MTEHAWHLSKKEKLWSFRDAYDRVKFLYSLVKIYPSRTVLIIGLLSLAGLFESIGLITLLPMLNIALNQSGADDRISALFGSVMSYLHIEPKLGPILLFIFITIVLKSMFTLASLSWVGSVMSTMAAELRAKLLRGILRADWPFFTSWETGSLVNAVTSECTGAAGAYRAAIQCIASLGQISVFLVTAAFVSTKLVLFSIIVGFFLNTIMSGFVTLAKDVGTKLAKTMRSFSVLATDSLQGMKAIKAMAREPQIELILEQHNLKLRKFGQYQVLLKFGLTYLREPIIVGSICAGLYFSVTLLGTSVTEVMTLSVIFYRIAANMGDFQSSYQQLFSNKEYYESVNRLILKTQRDVRPPAQVILGSSVQPIRLENVSFRYNANPILNNLTTTFEAGKFYAIRGFSGAGKTTLVDLITGLLRPTHGKIFIGETELNEASSLSWHQHIGYVPQEVFLFNSSIKKNITFDDPSISDADIEEALRLVKALDFISALPKGLDSNAGERGSKLSGGQRQRITIARALVRKPKLLILDESTTALDPETENDLVNSISALKRKMTIIAISHQQKLISAADYVISLENGQII